MSKNRIIKSNENERYLITIQFPRVLNIVLDGTKKSMCYVGGCICIVVERIYCISLYIEYHVYGLSYHCHKCVWVFFPDSVAVQHSTKNCNNIMYLEYFIEHYIFFLKIKKGLKNRILFYSRPPFYSSLSLSLSLFVFW